MLIVRGKDWVEMLASGIVNTWVELEKKLSSTLRCDSWMLLLEAP